MELNKMKYFLIITMLLIGLLGCKNYNTEILNAIENKDIKKIHEIVNIADIDINYKNKNGLTIFQMAKDSKNKDIINAINYITNKELITYLQGKWRIINDLQNDDERFYIFNFNYEKYQLEVKMDIIPSKKKINQFYKDMIRESKNARIINFSNIDNVNTGSVKFYEGLMISTFKYDKANFYVYEDDLIKKGFGNKKSITKYLLKKI